MKLSELSEKLKIGQKANKPAQMREADKTQAEMTAEDRAQTLQAEQAELPVQTVPEDKKPVPAAVTVLKDLPTIPVKAAEKALDQLKVTRRKLAGQRQNIQKAGIRKTLAKGGTASILGLSITIAGLFGAPEELIRQQTISQLHNPEAVEMVIDDEEPGSDEDLRRKAETRPEKKGIFQQIADAARHLIYQIPVPARAIVGIPLWAAGSGILYLLSGLYSVVLAPVLSHVIGYVLCAVILLAVFALTMKTIFPNMPFKKILRKRNIIRVLIGAAVVKATDIVLPLFWAEYIRYKYLILLGTGLIVLAVLIVPRIFRRRFPRQAQRVS